MKKWLLPMSLVMLMGVQAGTAEASASTNSSDTVKQTQTTYKGAKPCKVTYKFNSNANRYTYKYNCNTSKPSGGNASKPENKPSNGNSNNSGNSSSNGNTGNSGNSSSNGNTGNSTTSTVDQFEQKVIELTNVERQKAGLAALKSDKALMGAAREKSLDMQKNKYFSHTSPTFGSPFDRMKALGIQYSAAGENIAMGQKTPEEVVKGWMNSPGHRANIMSTSFTHIGVGYAANGNYWTQQFIKAK
ncbi:CAP domain-containing protein [Viridibacillus sp. NPDC093762]|uniref:CAP domain-containing protein n=1 Tax=Viridibacillus sp. NPDC093762 TaxID=3390720 RepID=UPI003D040893